MCARSLAATRSRRALPSTARSSHRRSTPARAHRTDSPVAGRRLDRIGATGVRWIEHRNTCCHQKHRHGDDRGRLAEAPPQHEQRRNVWLWRQFNPRVTDVAQAGLWIFFEAPMQQLPNAWRVFSGRALQSGSRSRTAAMVSASVSPGNAARPASISYSTQPNDQISLRLSTGLTSRLLGAHIGRRAQDCPLSRSDRHSETLSSRELDSSSVRTFASPKSSTFTVPSGVMLMLAGFKSR